MAMYSVELDTPWKQAATGALQCWRWPTRPSVRTPTVIYPDETGVDVVRVIFRRGEVELYSAVVD